MRTALLSFQWFAFILTSSIAGPIAIGAMFGLSVEEIATFAQGTLIVLGIAGLCQLYFGHRLPISESPAGLWWGVFVMYAGMIGVVYQTNYESLQALSGGMLFSAALFVVIGLTGAYDVIERLFTPSVTFVYLSLISFQLVGQFLPGMFGITSDDPRIDGVVLFGSAVVFLFMVYAQASRIPFFQRYNVIVALLIGWVLFVVLGKADRPPSAEGTLLLLPSVFPFGRPTLDTGVLVTSFFLTLLLMANLITSVKVMRNVQRDVFVKEMPKDARLKQSSYWTGFSHALSGLFNGVAPVPITGSAGFVASTRNTDRLPFVLGNIGVLLVSFIPAFILSVASIPIAVLYTVTLVIFMKVYQMSFYELDREPDHGKKQAAVGFGILIGVGAMSIPGEAFSELPPSAMAFLGNGLIIGTVVAMVAEQLYAWRKRRKKEDRS